MKHPKKCDLYAAVVPAALLWGVMVTCLLVIQAVIQVRLRGFHWNVNGMCGGHTVTNVFLWQCFLIVRETRCIWVGMCVLLWVWQHRLYSLSQGLNIQVVVVSKLHTLCVRSLLTFKAYWNSWDSCYLSACRKRVPTCDVCRDTCTLSEWLVASCPI